MPDQPNRDRRALDRVSYAICLYGLAAAAAVILLGPIVIVLMMSFTDAAAIRFPPTGFSFRWYEALFDGVQSAEVQRAAGNSFKAAIYATATATLLGAAAALAIGRRKWRLSRPLDVFFMSPLIVPALAFSLAALMYFTLLGFRPSMSLLVIGHVIVIVPFVVRTTLASLTQLDPALLECSASLGANSLYTLRRVTLPLIAPGIAAGAFIAFMSSFDNVSVSLFLSDARTEVLPIRMWGMLETQLDVRVAAVSGLITIAALVLLLAMDRLAGISRQVR